MFPQPDALLSEAPNILGTDGQKMSKSRGNTIEIGMTADATAKLIKKAVTDSDRHITYDPENRPEVANLLLLAALCTGRTPQSWADEIGDGGSGRLKAVVTEAVNSTFAPIRARRAELEADPGTSSRSWRPATPAPTRSPTRRWTRSALRWVWSTTGPDRLGGASRWHHRGSRDVHVP